MSGLALKETGQAVFPIDGSEHFRSITITPTLPQYTLYYSARDLEALARERQHIRVLNLQRAGIIEADDMLTPRRLVSDKGIKDEAEVMASTMLASQAGPSRYYHAEINFHPANSQPLIAGFGRVALAWHGKYKQTLADVSDLTARAMIPETDIPMPETIIRLTLLYRMLSACPNIPTLFYLDKPRDSDPELPVHAGRREALDELGFTHTNTWMERVISATFERNLFVGPQVETLRRTLRAQYPVLQKEEVARPAA
jgi:hypothetical protein